MAIKRFATVLVLSLALSGVAIAQKPAAQLPLTYIDTTWSMPTGTNWPAHTAAQFRLALTSAKPGDMITLDAGVVYTGNFVIPAKSNPNSQWIYVVSSNLSSLPAPGTQVSPSDAVNMPKIVTAGATQAIRLANGADHWRFVGIEIYSASTYAPSSYTPGVYYGYSLVDNLCYPNFTGCPNPPVLPHDITWDRMYVHGDATHDLQQGIDGNQISVAVVDSYISDIHMKGTDTQAFVAYMTPGPIKLNNNHLEAAGENVLIGGSGRGAGGWVPSDITVTNNYLYKPLSWVTPSRNGTWVVKNSFELKSAQRVLFDSNVIENKWSAGQVGGAFLFTIRTSQSGDIAVVHDVTVTNNIFKNVVRGFDLMEADYMCGTTSYPNCHNAGDTDRVVVQNNLILLGDTTQTGFIGQHTGLIVFTTGRDVINNVYPQVKDVLVQHNTVVPYGSQTAWGSVYFAVPQAWRLPFPYPPSTNVWVLDNVLPKQPSGDWGVQGMAGLNAYIGAPASPDVNTRYYGNVMYVPVGNKVQAFPPHNYATTVPIVYTNQSTADYQLVSPYWTDTSDGQLAGVNFTGSTGQSTGKKAVEPGSSLSIGKRR